MTRHAPHEPPPWHRGRFAAAPTVLAAALAAVLLATTAPARAQAEAGAETARRRGQFLRSEVVKTDVDVTFSCTLAPTSGSQPALLFRRQERQRHHEVRIYEVVLEVRTTDPETGRESVAFRVSPGDELRGETNVREVSRDLGPLVNESFTLSGAEIRTDDAGRFDDLEQSLLKPFDDLGRHTLEVEVRHRDLGTQTLRLSRYLTLRWESKRPDERLRLMQTDLLVALGLDFEPAASSDRQGLALRVEVPETLVPGQVARLRVTAVNQGQRPVSCLVARLVSRQPWFNGMNLYLGNVLPGSRREFERVIRVPDTAAAGALFGAVGFWDIRGPLEGAALPVHTAIVATPTAQPPAQGK